MSPSQIVMTPYLSVGPGFEACLKDYLPDGTRLKSLAIEDCLVVPTPGALKCLRLERGMNRFIASRPEGIEWLPQTEPGHVYYDGEAFFDIEHAHFPEAPSSVRFTFAASLVTGVLTGQAVIRAGSKPYPSVPIEVCFQLAYTR